MNDLCVEIGYNSINHVGEELCGDHVEAVGQGEDSSVLVLADGLGSGVKANILSILTSRIISTMIAEGLPLEECVKAIAATLPICSVRKVAYSTFTIIRLINNEVAEIICYDNPPVILIRNGVPTDLPGRDMIVGEDKKVHKSELHLQEGDILVAVSDGCPHAGIGVAYNFGWQLKDIADFIATASVAGYNAKTLSTMLVEECDRLYGGKPGDDATACVVRVRRRAPVNILFGPPRNRDDDARMMTLFFSKGCYGAHSQSGADLFLCLPYLHRFRPVSLLYPVSAAIQRIQVGVCQPNRCPFRQSLKFCFISLCRHYACADYLPRGFLHFVHFLQEKQA